MASAEHKRRASLYVELELEKTLALERARRGLLNFIRHTKPNYQVNWHHRLMAKHLNAIVEGTCKRLIITMPPRHGKSEQVSVRFPAYLLGRNPNAQIIAASYNATLAAKMNRQVQRVIVSPEYAELFPQTGLNNSNVRTTAQGSWLRNSDEFEVVGHAGFYRSAGVGGSATGYGATVGIIDDPVKNREEANSLTYRERNWEWYLSTFYSRLEKDGAVIICATRWHEDDLIGRLLRQAKENPKADQWTLLNLPAICEDEENPDDPRAAGQALWPEKYNLGKLELIRAPSERNFASLYQQRPAPAEGALIKRSWFRYWRQLPHQVDYLCVSCDLNAKDLERSDYTVMLVLMRSGADYYLIDMVRERMDFIKQKRALLTTIAQYPDLNDIYIEDASNGIPLIQDLRRSISGIVAVPPKGSKGLRLEAVAGLIEGGNLFLPDPDMPGYQWSLIVEQELCVFPSGANDDIVDALSQGLSRMRTRNMDFDMDLEILSKERPLAALHELSF